jgi:PAS domain S-box-containing protein
MKSFTTYWNRLGPRLILIFIALSALPLILVEVLAFENGRQTIEQNVFNHIKSINQIKASQFERWISENEFELEFLAQRPQVQELAATLASCKPDEEACQATRDHLLTNHFTPATAGKSGLSVLLLIRASDGLILAATEADIQGMYRESELYFLEGLRQTYTDEVTYSLSHGEAAMHIGTPVYGPEGEVVAVLAAHADLEVMSGFIETQGELIISEDTYMVNSFNFFVTEPRFGEGYALKKSARTPGIEGCLTGESAIALYDDYRDEPVIGAYKWLPAQRLCILTEVDQAEAYTPIKTLGYRLLGIGSVLALVASIAGIFFARGISNPIQELNQGVEEIGTGNLEYRIHLDRKDEIGELAAAFNQMAANLTRSLQQTALGERTIMALSQAAEAVQRAHTTDEVYHTVGTEVINLGYHSVIFSLINDQTALKVSYLSIKPKLLQLGEKLAGLSVSEYRQDILPGGIYDQIIQNKQAQFIPDMVDRLADSLPRLARPVVNKIVETIGFRQGIYAPLIVNEAVTGLLTIAGNDLSATDVPTVTTFANQIGIALENVQANQFINRRISELKALNTTTNIVTQAADNHQILARALDYVFEFAQVLAATLFLLDQDEGQLILKAHRGVPSDILPAVQTIIVGQGLTGRVAQTGKPEVTNQTADYHGEYKPFVDRDHMHSIAGIPLIGHNGLVGVMTLTSPTAQYFDPEGMKLLCSIGQQIAIGVEKNHLLEELKDFNQDLEERVAERTTELQTAQVATLNIMADLEDAWQKTEAANISLNQEKTFTDQIINSIPGVFYVFDANGKFIRWNDNFTMVTEYSDEEIAQMHPTELFQGDDQKIIGERIQLAFEKGTSDAEANFSTKSGRKIPYYFTGYRMLNNGKSLLIGTGMDISERKQAELALLESRARYQDLYDNAPDMYVSVDAHTGNIYRCNQTLANATGYSKQEILERSVFDMYHPDSLQDAQAAFQHFVANGQVIDAELQLMRKDGNKIDVSLNVSAVRDEKGNIIRSRSSWRDITDRVKMEQEIAKKATELERSNSELEQFAYVASHDLQEPLRMVASYLQLLERRYADKLDADAIEFIKFAVDGATRMKTLINDLLAYSRVGTHGKSFERTDLNSVLGQVRSYLMASIEETQTFLTCDELPTLLADEIQMVQLFQNLVSNAIKFRNEISPRVHIGVEKTVTEWVFSVSDNGIGIDPEYFERIFIIFQRLHAKGKYPGTGIGLAISKRIVERHHGRIWVESQPNEGTTFKFTIAEHGL